MMKPSLVLEQLESIELSSVHEVLLGDFCRRISQFVAEAYDSLGQEAAAGSILFASPDPQTRFLFCAFLTDLPHVAFLVVGSAIDGLRN